MRSGSHAVYPVEVRVKSCYYSERLTVSSESRVYVFDLDLDFDIMKVACLLAWSCALFSIKKSIGAAIVAPLDLITLDDLTINDRKHLEYINRQFQISKRSGSSDILSSIKNSIGQGIKEKLGQIAKGSAGASAGAISGFSKGSSKDYGYSHHHVPEHHPKTFDFWTLKKSILNTLLQAAKAIKGGVIAIKGKLITGGGKLISAKGKLISAKGEVITNLGKNIASSAVLSPYPVHHGYSASGPADISYGHYHDEHQFSAPSAPGPEYGPPSHEHYHHHEHDHADKLHGGIADGLLILKKKKPNTEHDHGSHAEESRIPNFKPIEPDVPNFGTIVAKLFSASSSLNPQEPALFDVHGHSSQNYPHAESNNHHIQDFHGGDNYFNDNHNVHTNDDSNKPTHAANFVDSSFIRHPHINSHSNEVYDVPHKQSMESLNYPTKDYTVSSLPKQQSYEPTDHLQLPTLEQKPLEEFVVPTSSIEHKQPAEFMQPTYSSELNSHPSNDHSFLNPPSTSYGTPFEQPPKYLDYDEFTAESIKSSKSLPLQNIHEIANSPKISLMMSPKYQSYPPLPLESNVSFNMGIDFPYNGPLAPSYINQPFGLASTMSRLSEQPDFVEHLSQLHIPIKKNPIPHMTTFQHNKHSSEGRNLHNLDSISGILQQPRTTIRSPFTRQQHMRMSPAKKPHSIDIVKSISFELGPNGPRML